jgi:hypothetical protein
MGVSCQHCGIPDNGGMILPFASSQDPAALSRLPDLQLPHLQALLGRLQPQPLSDPALGEDSPHLPHEWALAQALGLQRTDANAATAGLPWAAAHSNAPSDAQAWFTPCHYQIGMDHVRLIPPDDLALSAEHSQALCHALAELCREDGLELQWLRADRWLARGPALSGVASLSLDRVSGRSIETQHLHQSAGLKRLHNEAQMLFYTQPAHDERVAQGLLPINGFWLSGAGACATAPDWSRRPVVIDALQTHALRGDWAAWASAWAEVDAALAEPLARVLAGQALSLTLCGERHSQVWQTPNTPVSPWRVRWQALWQKPPSATAVLSAL